MSNNKNKLEILTKNNNQREEKEVKKQEIRFKDYLKNFDDEFGLYSQEQLKKTPILKSMFNKFMEQIYKPSKAYKIAINTEIKIKEELVTTLNEEQKNMLEKLQYCEDKISDYITEQAYIYGFSMCNQIKEETKKLKI